MLCFYVVPTALILGQIVPCDLSVSCLCNQSYLFDHLGTRHC